MPGLFGIFHTDQHPVDIGILDQMALSMQHQPGLHMDLHRTSGWEAGRIHLGIFNPESQPVTGENDRYQLWLDGEVTNCEALQRQYGLDSESIPVANLILALYRQFGWEFLGVLDGIFVLALYDQEMHELTLVSDRYGLRPLYWVRTSEGIAYAGEVKALLKVPGVRMEIDPQAVDEWFSFGHLLGDRTWIKDVLLLPSATIMRIGREGMIQNRYWSWHEVQISPSPHNEADIVDELGQRWIQAVERRLVHQRTGQFLSGGLDSRAIIAALPPDVQDYRTFTFGVARCDDLNIARRVAKQRGAHHHFFEITAADWLFPRIDAIWRTDGMLRLFDLHGVEAIPMVKSFIDINVHGYLGDATVGGSYLSDTTDIDAYLLKKIDMSSPLALPRNEALQYLRNLWSRDRYRPDHFLIEQRGRRFINLGLVMQSAWLEVTLPFFDHTFMSLVMSIPEDLRRHSYIYNKMLLKFFPQFFARIPWQQTGLPIGAPHWRYRLQDRKRMMEEGLQSFLQRLHVQLPRTRKSYVDYLEWMRQEPASGLMQRLLVDRDALCLHYVDSDKARSIIHEFMNDRNHHLTTIGLLLSFEIYLSQLFEPASILR